MSDSDNNKQSALDPSDATATIDLSEETDARETGDSSDVSEATESLVAATDGAGGIKSTDESSAVPNETVGHGDSSPTDLAHGFQPVAGASLEEQLSPPEPDDSEGEESPVDAEANFGARSLNVPPGTDKDDVKAMTEENPGVTHQGQPGSGVQPGAALPGETVEQREARRAARLHASELARSIENGNFRFSGRLRLSEGGGFDIVAAEGTDDEIRLSEVLAAYEGRFASLETLNIQRM